MGEFFKIEQKFKIVMYYTHLQIKCLHCDRVCNEYNDWIMCLHCKNSPRPKLVRRMLLMDKLAGKFGKRRHWGHWDKRLVGK